MTLFKRPDSEVWQYEFVVAGQRYRGSTKTSSKRDAAAFEVDKRREALEDQNNSRLGVKRMTVSDLAIKWLESSQMALRDHTNNESRVRKLFGDELKQKGHNNWVLVVGARKGLSRDLMVHEVTQDTLMTLKASRVTEGNSAATINRELSLIQTLMGYAEALNVVLPARPIVWSQKRNKAASLKAPESSGKLRWLTQAEEHMLLERLRGMLDPDKVATQDNLDLTMFLLDTGARYNEVARIKWDQINLETGVIDLYRTKVDNEGRLRLTRRSWEMLKRRREATWPKSYVFPGMTDGGREYSKEDKPRGHATDGIQRAIDRCGFNQDVSKGRVTPHTFRDTYASRLVQAGVSLLKVSHLLGHADESMTKKYAHLCPDSAGQEAAAVLDGLHGN